MPPRRVRPWLFLGPALAAALLSAAPAVRAVSCSGAAHSLTLDAGQVSPGSGTTSTPFTFSVVYTDNAGCAPTSITATIQGVGSLPLQAATSDYAAGVTFSRTTVLPAGSWAYSFSASSGSGPGAGTVSLTAVNPSVVVVLAPTPVPTPMPTPPPTPPPTPRPTPRPTPAPTVAPSPAGASPTPSASLSPSGGASPSTSASPTAAPSAAGVHSASATPSAASSTAASDGAGAAPPGSANPGAGGGSAGPPPGLFQVGGVIGANAATIAWLMATGLSLALFFYLVSRRLDLPLTETGFSLSDEPAAGGVVQLPATRRGGPARGDETNLPRWLRPSVQAARFTTAEDGPREHGD